MSHAASEEHEFEAEHGLPEPLPPGERLLWQGAPVFSALVERAFHARTLAVYFGIILLARGTTVWAQGGSALDGIVAMLWLLPAALFALGMVVLLAWLTCRTTVYTITDRRVVLRVGIVLTVTYNLPYAQIEAAAFRPDRGRTGEIALTLAGADKIAYLHLWPHARPWRVRRTEPMLRCVDEGAQVARLLSGAWSEARGIAVSPAAAQGAARPEPMSLPVTAVRRPHGLSAAR
jgi:Bacterial PH domain